MAAERPATPRLRGAAARSSQAHGISAETISEMRGLYEASSLSVTAIGARLGVSHSSVARLAEKYGWRRPAAADARRRLVGEIRKRADEEIVAAERALAGGSDPGPAARTLASLVKTLRELARFDEEQGVRLGGPGSDEDTDGFVADPDAFREALAERLEKLRDEREA